MHLVTRSLKDVVSPTFPYYHMPTILVCLFNLAHHILVGADLNNVGYKYLLEVYDKDKAYIVIMDKVYLLKNIILI